jgi:small conductance mechanosensitive channel
MRLHRVAAVFVVVLLAAGQAHAQEEQTAAGPKALSGESRTRIEERFDEIESLKDEVADLSQRLEDSEGLARTIADARLLSVRSSLFDATLSLAKDLAAEQERGIAVDTLKQRLRAELEVFPQQATDAVDRLAEAIQFDYRELSPREAVVSDRTLLLAVRRVDAVLSALAGYTEIAAGMDLDASQQVGFLREKLADQAANRSVFLEVAISQVGLARSSSAALPKDEELLSWVAAAEARVRVASSALQGTVNLMNRTGMDTRSYRQQIVTATGALTTDVLDVGVFAGLISEWSKTAFNFTKSEAPRLIFSVLLAILILFVFIRLSRLVKKGAESAMLSRRVTMSHLLKRMVVSTARTLTIFIGILFALSQLGISLGPLLTGLGIAGFIIGFALQDTLSNFASGMMILVYRPFDVGDFVQAGGVTGKVDRMSLVNTTFKTFDNQVIVVPNNMIWQQAVINLTAQRTRRVDFTFSISYGDDIDKAKAILREVVDSHEAVLKDPEPNIRVGALGESGVELLCRPWVLTDDYWDVFWDITERVKKRFDEAGITIPFPQRTVHTYTPNEA